METTSSGTSELPGILAYPAIAPLDEVPEIKGQLVYIIKGYQERGFAAIVKRIPGSDKVNIQFGDFDGNNLVHDQQLDGLAAEFLCRYAPTLVGMMKYMGVEQMVFYMAIADNGPILVDVRLSLDKFCGPGMIRDLFSKVIPVQETIKIAQLDEPTWDAIIAGAGTYAGPLMIKCSAFKTVVRGNDLLPLYGKVRASENRA